MKVVIEIAIRLLQALRGFITMLLNLLYLAK